MPQRLKVIVAEDNDIQREYLAQLIDNLGYEAIQAEDGRVALNLVQETGARIVLSDYQMPHLTGIELTQEVRKLGLDHYVHIIMITGRDEVDLQREALEAGVDDFLNKGRSQVMLKARIRAATRLIKHAMALARRAQMIQETNDRIQADLHAAAAAQRQLLPSDNETILGFRISSTFVPSSFVSGDMFGCFELSETKLGFYAVDVSGHGVHAALLSVAIGHLITREYFMIKACGPNCQPDPAALVADLNQRFSRGENDDYFTMFCGIFDTETGRLDFCQAGAPSPYLVSPQGQVTLVGDGGFPVGMFADVPYTNEVIDIAPGGVLVVCSDAAIEAENRLCVPFGTDRVAEIAGQAPRIGAENIPRTIKSALRDWRDDKTLEDDLTIVALERTIPHDTYDTA